MKIVVVSDSHGVRDTLDQVLEENKDAVYFLHCGDICLEPFIYPQYTVVGGNNDYYNYPDERIVEAGEHRILMVHSHLEGYYKREEKLIKKAKKLSCDIVCFGHTHVAYYRQKEGIHLLNPGSLYHARDGRPPSYAKLYLDGEQVDVEFIFLDK